VRYVWHPVTKRHRKDLNILLELVTIVLVGFYAYEAWWQAYEGRLTATAVHENAVKDLRAYISVGGPPNHKMAEIRRTGPAVSPYQSSSLTAVVLQLIIFCYYTDTSWACP
jgi:hypothetical protein